MSSSSGSYFQTALAAVRQSNDFLWRVDRAHRSLRLFHRFVLPADLAVLVAHAVESFDFDSVFHVRSAVQDFSSLVDSHTPPLLYTYRDRCGSASTRRCPVPEPSRLSPPAGACYRTPLLPAWTLLPDETPRSHSLSMFGHCICFSMERKRLISPLLYLNGYLITPYITHFHHTLQFKPKHLDIKTTIQHVRSCEMKMRPASARPVASFHHNFLRNSRPAIPREEEKTP